MAPTEGRKSSAAAVVIVTKVAFLVGAAASALGLSGCKTSDCPGGLEGQRRTVVYPPCAETSCDVGTVCSQLEGAKVGYACMLSSEHTIVKGIGSTTEQNLVCDTLGGQKVASDLADSMICIIKGTYSVLDVLCPTRTDQNCGIDKGCLDFHRSTCTDKTYSITTACTAISGNYMGDFKCIVPGVYTIITTYFSDGFYADSTDVCTALEGQSVGKYFCILKGSWTVAASEKSNSAWGEDIGNDPTPCQNLGGYFVRFKILISRRTFSCN